LFLIGHDKLIVYAVLLVLVATLIRLIYGIYCDRFFEECHYQASFNKKLIKEMTVLAGWNLLGSSGQILNSHGINLLMNLFFGVTVNAARGLAVQVNSAVTQFVNSFTTAVNPQITKSYAQGYRDYLFKLVMMSSKYSFFMMLLLVAPIIAETPIILKFWLKIVPDYTILFVRLTLVSSLISTLSSPLYTLALATGNIKKYQIVVGSLSLSCFFITYICYKLGMPVETAYFVNIVIQIVVLFARLKILSSLTGISIEKFLKEVIITSVVVSIAVIVCIYLLLWIFSESTIVSAIIVAILCILISTVFIILFGLKRDERSYIINTIKKK
jgi:O-antigen/teichoic acid export membrane protein